LESRTLFLIVNTRCEIACKYCFYTSGYEARDQVIIEPEDLGKAIVTLKKLGFSTIIITGGEPLSRRYFEHSLHIIKALKRNGFTVIVNTSGVNLDFEACSRLVLSDPDRIDISLDSHEESINNNQRGGYTDVIKTMNNLSILGYIKTVATIVITDENSDSILETFYYLKALGIGECRLQPAFIPKNNKSGVSKQVIIGDKLRRSLELISTLSPTPDVTRKYFKYWERYYGDQTDDIVKIVNETPICNMGKSSFVALSNWDMIGCFHRKDLTYGNILLDTAESIEEKIHKCELFSALHPSCAGAHCVSLFSRPKNWQTQESIK